MRQEFASVIAFFGSHYVYMKNKFVIVIFRVWVGFLHNFRTLFKSTAYRLGTSKIDRSVCLMSVQTLSESQIREVW